MNAPACTIDDIGMDITGEDVALVIASVDEYLKDFLPPIRAPEGDTLEGSILCAECHKPLCGLCGTFRYDICWGEGHCSSCGYPTRLHHIPIKDGKKVFDQPFTIPLQYRFVVQAESHHDAIPSEPPER